jgi:hypothetical protein
VLHMDRGILYSLKELMLRPGHLMRAYLEGRRAKQVKPLLLLMISAAAVLLLGKLLLDGDIVGPAMELGFSGSGAPRAGAGLDPAVLSATFAAAKDWLNGHMTAFTLLCLPLEAAAFWLAFKGRGLNYPEWLVVSAFLTVQSFAFMAIAIVMQRWIPSAQAWTLPFVVVYTVFSLVQLFDRHSGWTSTLRALAGLGMFMVAQSMMVGGAVFALFLLLNHG